MSAIVNINEKITMTSLEIAKLTGKRHDHILRDIEEQLKGVCPLPRFGESYLAENRRTYKMYRLPKRETLILVSGYSVELRAKIIDRLEELERQSHFSLPDFTNPAEAARAWADEIDKNRALETKIATDAPKVAFAEALSASTKCILVRDFVKILHQNGIDTGEKRFYEYLRESGYLMQAGESRNKPTQKAMALGLFEVSTNLISCAGGEQLLKHTSKITPKGQKYFIEKLGAATGVS